MPRKSRIDAAGALHHIIARGIERGKIFTESILLLGLPGAGDQYGSAFAEVEHFRISGEFVG